MSKRKVCRPLITEMYLDTAKRRLKEVGQSESLKQIKMREPHLYSVICEIANQAVSDRPEDLGDETQTVIWEAIWRAVLVGIEAYRVSQFHFWADTCLGPWMEKLDPELADRAFRFLDPPPDIPAMDDDEGDEWKNGKPDGGNGA